MRVVVPTWPAVSNRLKWNGFWSSITVAEIKDDKELIHDSLPIV